MGIFKRTNSNNAIFLYNGLQIIKPPGLKLLASVIPKSFLISQSMVDDVLRRLIIIITLVKLIRIHISDSVAI